MEQTNHMSHRELVDIRDVHIDSKLPQEERIRSFIRQVKNPYRFKVGDITVNICIHISSYNPGIIITLLLSRLSQVMLFSFFIRSISEENCFAISHNFSFCLAKY